MSTKPTIPKNYRLVKMGEVIRKGDKHLSDREEVAEWTVGVRVVISELKLIRRKEAKK